VDGLKKKELYERINEMAMDYIEHCEGFNEELSIKAMEKVLSDKQIHINCCTGYLGMSSWLYAKNKNILFGPVFHQCLHWNKTKVFFSFNEQLEQEIQNSNWDCTANVPAILLNQCPFTSFFIQTNTNFVNYNYENQIDGKPDIEGKGLGFFVTISPGRKQDKETYKFSFNGDKVMDITFCANSIDDVDYMNTLTVSLEIPSNNQAVQIKDAIIFSQDYDKVYKDDEKKILLCKKNDMEMLIKALQYILHLCSKNSEIIPRMPVKKSFMTKRQKANAKVKCYEINLKPSERNFPIHHNSQHSGNHTGETRKSHVRRAHWAFRWCGSKAERHLEIRWIKECIIHPEMQNAGTILNVRR